MKALPKLGPLLRKHRDRVALIGLLLSLVLFIGVGLTLQKSSRNKPIDPELEAPPIKVQLKSERSEVGEQKSSTQSTTAYFLKPSPAELLEQLNSMDNLNDNVVNAKFSGLKMLWPLYFFSLTQVNEQNDDKRDLLADVSADGFGVIVKAVVSLTDFPQLGEVKRGQKIWLGGELLAIDSKGTGVIYIAPEYISTGDQPAGINSSSDKKTD